MIVDDLDIGWSSGCPDEADPPLLVDPHAVLTSPITLQFLQSITRRYAKVTDDIGRIEHGQLPQRCLLRRGIECSDPLAAPDEFGGLVPERLEHSVSLTSSVNNVKRYRLMLMGAEYGHPPP